MKFQINVCFFFILIWAITGLGCGEDSPSSSVQPGEESEQIPGLEGEEGPQSGTVSGIITEVTTGTPIPGATVSLLDQTVETGADGSYVFTNISYSDNHNLIITDIDYHPKTEQFALRSEQVILEISLLPKFGAVSGVITDATTGNPIPGVTVNLLDWTLKTEADGRYNFAQVGYSEAHNLIITDVDYQPKTESFELRTERVALNILLVPLTNPEAEIIQFLEVFSALIESMDIGKLGAIQGLFSETYLAGDDLVTLFVLATGIIPATFDGVIPSITKVFEEYDAVEFRFRNIQVDVIHARKVSARLTLDTISEKGPRPDRREISVECRMDFHKENSVWKIVFWQLFKVDILL
jgi:hypothetical protein